MQIDILFVLDFPILHCLDEATRLTVLAVLESREAPIVLSSFRHEWIRRFNPP